MGAGKGPTLGRPAPVSPCLPVHMRPQSGAAMLGGGGRATAAAPRGYGARPPPTPLGGRELLGLLSEIQAVLAGESREQVGVAPLLMQVHCEGVCPECPEG